MNYDINSTSTAACSVSSKGHSVSTDQEILKNATHLKDDQCLLIV